MKKGSFDLKSFVLPETVDILVDTLDKVKKGELKRTIIAITGGPNSGKSTLMGIFKQAAGENSSRFSTSTFVQSKPYNQVRAFEGWETNLFGPTPDNKVFEFQEEKIFCNPHDSSVRTYRYLKDSVSTLLFFCTEGTREDYEKMFSNTRDQMNKLNFIFCSYPSLPTIKSTHTVIEINCCNSF